MTSIRDDENLQQLVLQRRWTDVERRVRIHSEELKLTNNDGLNVLHLACCRNIPSSSLRVMLQHDAIGGHNSVLMTEWYGRNPLMYICDGRGPLSLVKDFCEISPKCVVGAEKGGWTPLHFLCVNTREHSNITHEMAKLLLSVDKRQVSAKDAYGQTPLKLLCDQFESLASELVGHPSVDLYQLHIDPRSVAGLVQEVEYFWELACTLVQSYCPHPTKTPMLHQFCSFPKCPDVLLAFALQAYPEHMTQCDMDGNTPLHLAVLQDDADLMLRLLACGCDGLRIWNNSGHLPIALAFASPWSEVSSILLQKHPGGLEATGFKDTLYTNLFAKEEMTPNTIFSILRSQPALLKRDNYKIS
jgi:ankyrin repeat protein